MYTLFRATLLAVVSLSLTVAASERAPMSGDAPTFDQYLSEGEAQALVERIRRHRAVVGTDHREEYALHLLPLIPPPGVWPQGFYRLANVGREDDTFELLVLQDDGELAWAVDVDVPAGYTRHVNSDDLAGRGTKPYVRMGNRLREPSEEGLYWGLAETGRSVHVSAFTRSRNGFINDVGSMKVAARQESGDRTTVLGTANPGRNRGTVGFVRYLNLDVDNYLDLDVWAYDDNGMRSGTIACSLLPGSAWLVEIAALESGCGGSWGTGSGKWEVHANSGDQLHLAMSFMYSVDTGILANVTDARVLRTTHTR